MIVDSSAIVAILLGEPEADLFLRRLASDPSPRLSAGSWVELAAVGTQKLGSRLFGEMYAYVDATQIVIAPVTVVQARIAHDAYRRYGRGSGHPAKLNFGDCFSYALARETGEPLLFKGDDFSQTDVEPAV